MVDWIRKNKGVIVFLLAAGVFRSSVANWNYIPSGSMRPTLLEGDVVAYNPIAYDVKIPLVGRAVARMGDPERGDIVLFDSPKDGSRLIKRVIGIPGDVVAIHDGVLMLNGVEATYEGGRITSDLVGSQMANVIRATESVEGKSWAVQHVPQLVARADLPPVTIPPEQYLMLGDNRENSADSRYFGLVKRDSLIGKASRVIVSANIVLDNEPRLSRIMQPLH